MNEIAIGDLAIKDAPRQPDEEAGVLGAEALPDPDERVEQIGKEERENGEIVWCLRWKGCSL
jgi:hypothetical protein